MLSPPAGCSPANLLPWPADKRRRTSKIMECAQLSAQNGRARARCGLRADTDGVLNIPYGGSGTPPGNSVELKMPVVIFSGGSNRPRHVSHNPRRPPICACTPPDKRRRAMDLVAVKASVQIVLRFAKLEPRGPRLCVGVAQERDFPFQHALCVTMRDCARNVVNKAVGAPWRLPNVP